MKNKENKGIKRNSKKILIIGFIITVLTSIFAADKNQYNSLINSSNINSSIPHAAISIDGNAALIAFPDKTGNGTISNPYIIEDLEIILGGSGYCIEIRNTNLYLTINNCTLDGQYGILFSNTEYLNFFIIL